MPPGADDIDRLIAELAAMTAAIGALAAIYAAAAEPDDD